MKELFEKCWTVGSVEALGVINITILSVGVAVGIVFVIVLIFNKCRGNLFF